MLTKSQLEERANFWWELCQVKNRLEGDRMTVEEAVEKLNALQFKLWKEFTDKGLDIVSFTI